MLEMKNRAHIAGVYETFTHRWSSPVLDVRIVAPISLKITVLEIARIVFSLKLAVYAIITLVSV